MQTINQRLKTAARAYPAITLWVIVAPLIFVLFFVVSRVA